MTSMAPVLEMLSFALPLRETWKSDSELTEDEAGQYGTEKASESAEYVVVQRRLRGNEVNGLCGNVGGVVLGHGVPPVEFEFVLDVTAARCCRHG